MFASVAGASATQQEQHKVEAGHLLVGNTSMKMQHFSGTRYVGSMSHLFCEGAAKAAPSLLASGKASELAVSGTLGSKQPLVLSWVPTVTQ